MTRLHIAALISVALVLPRAGFSQQEDRQQSAPQPDTVDSCIANHTIGGAVIGGILGALLGGRDRRGGGAVGGALAGGIAGYLVAWSKCSAQHTKVSSQPVAGYNETAKLTKYTTDMGTVVKIEEFFLDPSALRPGNTVRLSGSYYIMAPSESEVNVVETRVLRCQDPSNKQVTEIERDSTPKTVAPGYRSVSGEFPIPSQAPSNPGMLCAVEFEIAAGDKKNSARYQFAITGNDAYLASAAERDQRAREQREAAKSQRASLLAMAEPASAAGAKTVQEVAGAKPATGTPSGGASSAGGGKTAEAPIRQLMVTAERTNVRKNPDTKAQVVGSVARGERYPLFETIEISGRTWYQLRLDDGNKAWISGSAAKPAE